VISRLMVMKNVSRSIVCRNQGSGEKGLGLDGESITTSDLNFVIDGVRLIAFFWMYTFSYLMPLTRTWYTSRSRRLAGAMLAGLSKITKGHSGFLMI
jgi:hypothetical protein